MTLVLQSRDGGFDSRAVHSDITQLGECFPYKEEATSSPVRSLAVLSGCPPDIQHPVIGIISRISIDSDAGDL